MATKTLADYGYFCFQTHSAVSIMGSRPSAQFPSLELEDEPGPHWQFTPGARFRTHFARMLHNQQQEVDDQECWAPFLAVKGSVI